MLYITPPYSAGDHSILPQIGPAYLGSRVTDPSLQRNGLVTIYIGILALKIYTVQSQIVATQILHIRATTPLILSSHYFVQHDKTIIGREDE